MKTILLKFAGPLQSWGINSNFETRYTDRYPSKSAVIGMIAASLGYRRDKDENIKQLNTLDFGVRIDQPGNLLKDFQIATKYKKTGVFDRTYVTNRYYLEDAVFTVAIGSKDENLINLIEQSLKSPVFQLFLGRRSLPINVDFFIGVSELNVVESLREVPWQASVWYKKKQGNVKEINVDAYVDGDLIKNYNYIMVKDKAISFSQKKREHDFRVVSKMRIEIPLDQEHDAMSAIGG